MQEASFMKKWGFMDWLQKDKEDKAFSIRHDWPHVSLPNSFEEEQLYNMRDSDYLRTMNLSTTEGKRLYKNLEAGYFRSMSTRGWLPRLVYSRLFNTIFRDELAPDDILYNHFLKFYLQHLAAFSSVSPTNLLLNHYQFDINQCRNVKHLARIKVGMHVLILCHDENGLVLGTMKVLSNKKIIWCCKVSESEFVIAHSVGVSRPSRKSSRSGQSSTLSSTLEMTLFKTSSGELLPTTLNISDKFRDEIVYPLQHEGNISAFSDVNNIIFVTNLHPLHTVTYIRNKEANGSIMHEDVVKERKSYELFQNLSAFQESGSMEILPQSAAINENGNIILCGKMVFHDKNGCAPNAFIENFGYRDVGTYTEVVTTTLQFFYRLEKRNGYQITGVSSAFHPSLPDESVTIYPGDKFVNRYSVKQTVVGLDASRGTTLLFWNGTSNTKNNLFETQLQVLDQDLIYSIISSKRKSIRNFSLHANYFRALKPNMVRHKRSPDLMKHFYMVGARRTSGKEDRKEVKSTAFNATIQNMSNGRLFVLMRQTEDVFSWDKPNELVVEIGSFDRTNLDYKALETKVVPPGDTSGIMDARLIHVPGAVYGNFYVIYYTNLNTAEVETENKNRQTRGLPSLEDSVRSRMYIQKGNWLKDKNIAHTNGGGIPTPFCHYRSRSATEKNWSVFVTGKGDLDFSTNMPPSERVKFIMSIDPLIVYCASKVGTNSVEFQEDCPREKSVNLPLEFSYMLQQNRLDLRGGSCGVPYGQEGDFLFVGHALQKADRKQKTIIPCFPDYFVGEWHSWEKKSNRRKDIRRAEYDQMYWVFFYVVGKDVSNRWKVKQMSMCSQLHGRSVPYPKIAFASGLTRVENGYNVAFGEWDQSSVFTFLSNDFMEAILRPTEELDNQSYVADCALFESLLLDYADDGEEEEEKEEDGEEEEEKQEEEEEEEEEEKEEEFRKRKDKGKGKNSSCKKRRGETTGEIIDVPDSDEEKEIRETAPVVREPSLRSFWET